MKICGDASYKIQLLGFQDSSSQDANLYKKKEGKQITDQDHNVNTANTVSRQLPEEDNFHTGKRKQSMHFKKHYFIYELMKT